MTDSALDSIAALAQKWRQPLSDAQVRQVCDFFRLLLQWNARVNLTGATGMDELVEEHLPDSFALASLVPAGANLVDVGAGGGLPGVPFALLRPDCSTTLFEPRAKRTAFLGAAKRLLGAAASRLEVIRGRAEDLPEDRFDVAASRATFEPQTWLRVARGFVQGNKRAIVFSTSPVDGCGEGYELVDSSSYSTGRNAPRWAGAFVPRGTAQAR